MLQSSRLGKSREVSPILSDGGKAQAPRLRGCKRNSAVDSCLSKSGRGTVARCLHTRQPSVRAPTPFEPCSSSMSRLTAVICLSLVACALGSRPLGDDEQESLGLEGAHSGSHVLRGCAIKAATGELHFSQTHCQGVLRSLHAAHWTSSLGAGTQVLPPSAATGKLIRSTVPCSVSRSISPMPCSDCYRAAGAIASGAFVPGLRTASGWGQLHVTTSGDHSDLDQLRAAGFLEVGAQAGACL